jgi:hypothetical protein
MGELRAVLEEGDDLLINSGPNWYGSRNFSRSAKARTAATAAGPLGRVTTPLIMLALMTMPYLALRASSSLMGGVFDAHRAAAIGLGILFVFTGIGHFIQTGPMVQMLPPWVPGRLLLVDLAGAASASHSADPDRQHAESHSHAIHHPFKGR